MNPKAFLLGYMSKVAAGGFSTLPEAVAAQGGGAGGDAKSSSEITIDKPKGKIKARGKAADTLANNPTTVSSVDANIPPPHPKEPKAAAPGDQPAPEGAPVDLGMPTDLPPELQPSPESQPGVPA